MKELIKLATVVCAVGSFAPVPVLALSAISSGSVSNSYLFIENTVDNQHFITSSTLDPRFTGANSWTKYNSSQMSLGYLGFVNWVVPGNYYQDMWIDNSPINEPFQGIRCNRGDQCPSTGFIAGLGTDKKGFYHAQVGSRGGVIGGAYGFASLTDNAYNFFRDAATGSSQTYVLHHCYTSVDYDYSSGQRCKDQSTGSWKYINYTLTKLGHLSLVSTNALQDLWVASDGTPSVSKDSDNCVLGVVDGTDGVICKILSYNLQQKATLGRSLNFRGFVDTAIIGFTPKGNTVRYSGNGSNWYDYNTKTIYYNVFTNTGKYVYIFLSKEFLKHFVDSGSSITNSQPFTFGFHNDLIPESGYYQFTPSLRVNIVPKEYGISIVSSDNTSSASGSGTVGDAAPIEIDYTVTVSGPRQADSITAQVIGESTTINSVPYCLFTSAKGGPTVPIPAFLQYNSQSGGVVQKRNSCSEAAVSMRDAQWQQTPWDANSNDDGSYYTTDLKLLFPMNDSRSMLTVSGSDWEGVVSASGEIKVTANWVGVTP